MKKTCISYISCREKKRMLFKKKGYPIFECRQCSHRMLEISDLNHLSNVYSDNYFFGGKDGYPNYLDEKEILYRYGTKYAKIIAKYAKPGKVLDAGCAAGFILKGFEQSGWSCQGVEPNETMASYGRDKLNLNIKTNSLETFETNEKFDLIIMIQVIGHFYDLDKALQNATYLLKRNGLILVESWNMKSMLARLMGKRWHEYSPPSVVHWFSNNTLADLFNFYGCEIVANGHPEKRISAKHALSLLDGKTPNFIFKRKLIDLLNRLIGNFKLIYPPLDLKWYIFRKL